MSCEGSSTCSHIANVVPVTREHCVQVLSTTVNPIACVTREFPRMSVGRQSYEWMREGESNSPIETTERPLSTIVRSLRRNVITAGTRANEGQQRASIGAGVVDSVNDPSPDESRSKAIVTTIIHIYAPIPFCDAICNLFTLTVRFLVKEEVEEGESVVTDAETESGQRPALFIGISGSQHRQTPARCRWNWVHGLESRTSIGQRGLLGNFGNYCDGSRFAKPHRTSGVDFPIRYCYFRGWMRRTTVANEPLSSERSLL